MKPVTINPQFDDLQNSATLINHVQELQNQLEVEKQSKGLFKVKTANEWMEEAKNTPIPEMLFGEFWHENEICILFADSNLGKSILAVQIANSVSKGEKINGFKLEAPKQPVLYFDFELSAKQFEVRYSLKVEGQKVFENHYSFDDNFMRVEIDPEEDGPNEKTEFENYLNQSFEKSIIDTGAKVLIVDNLTYLKDETERSKDALPLMKYLKALKSKYGLSILALAHTPKRDLSRPITQNDLGGSKMLFNFIDSCFALGQSNTDKNIRYIKQVKARNTAMIYDTDNVVVCQLDKPFNYLAFEFIAFGAEQEHLKHYSKEDKENTIEQAKALSSEGYSQREIQNKLGIALGTVNKYINS
jgi:RecA-family ATPase